MLLKYFYDKALAHASYLVGCQRTGEAVVIDAGRDIQQYLDAAAAEGLHIVAAADTHIHADYVSGARELADRIGARLYVSDEGPAEWKFEYASAYDHQLLRDGDVFSIGGVDFKVLYTPGHTPESISFVLTDRGGGADAPMGVFTGDFVFVGSIGRPDLLEEAAGMVGTAEPGARELFHSIAKFRELPDHLQIWPAHGAGSACGKGLGAIPSSTVGYEKLFNPALQFDNEQAFVDYILSEQPEAPKYFAVMKRVNREGPAILGEKSFPEKLDVNRLSGIAQTEQVVDIIGTQAFAAAHVPGTIGIPAATLAAWAGFLLDYDRPIHLIAGESDLPEAVRVLQKIGVDRVAGYFCAEEVANAGLRTASIVQKTPREVAAMVESGDAVIVDVRSKTERESSMIPGSEYSFLGKLADNIGRFPKDRNYVFQCRSGGRSVIASSIAQRAGIESVFNLQGGITAWKQAGLAVGCGDAPADRQNCCA